MAKRKRSRIQQPTAAAPPRPDESYSELAYITPTIAEEWLALNKQNRPRGAPQVAKLARAMNEGGWKVNGETIKIDVNGVLRDGQTRLEAVVHANTPIWSWVICDLEAGIELFETIDQGRLRTLGHMLAIRDYKNYNSLAAAIRLVYARDPAIPREAGGFTSAVGVAIVEARPGIVKSLAYVRSEGMREVWSSGLSAGLHHLMQKTDRDVADAFWHSLATGEINRQKSPVRVVRDCMIANKSASKDSKLTLLAIQAIVIKGWNLTRLGKTAKYIRWNPEREEFPVIR